MPNLGLSELVVIFLIVVLVFGASRLPQLGEGLGRAIKNFKKGVASDDRIQVKPGADSAPTSESAQGSAAQADDAEIVEHKR